MEFHNELYENSGECLQGFQKSSTNQSVQLQKIAGGLKFQI